MRRLLLLVAILGLIGLSTAFAASLSVQTEDVSSFTTPVSISVPDPPGTLVSYFLSGDDNVLPGYMAPNPPADTSVNSKMIRSGTLSVQAQTVTDRYHSWQTDPAPTGGLVLDGPAVLRIFQNGSVAAATAGLFECATATTATTACTQIAGDSSSAGTESAGTEVPIAFGNVTATIPAGSVLRAQVVNRSSSNWNLQWGYKTNRQSRLDITVVTP